MKRVRARSFGFIILFMAMLLALSAFKGEKEGFRFWKEPAPETVAKTSYPYECIERNALSSYGKSIYDQYLPSLKELEPIQIDLYSIQSQEQAYDVCYALIALTKDYPVIENYLDPYENYFEKDGFISYKSRWEPFSIRNQDIKAGVKKMQAVADTIIKEMPQDLSTYDKYLYLASELCKITQYDEKLTEEGMRSYGALVDGFASCSGYAAAYRYLCQRANLWCDTVVSDTHAWNLVKLESGTYHMDVTWADEFEPYTRGWYQFVFMTQEEVLQLDDHKIADETVADGTAFKKYQISQNRQN